MTEHTRDILATIGVYVFSALLITAGFMATWDYATEEPPFWEEPQCRALTEECGYTQEKIELEFIK